MDYERIFGILKKNGKISTNELYSSGATDEFIDNMVETDIFEYLENDEYKIKDVDELIYYGRELLDRKKYREANIIFTCGYVTDPTNFNANYQLFYRSLINKNLHKYIFNHFDVVYNYMKQNGIDADANYYLFLLGNIFDLPKKYKKDFKSLEEADLLLIEYDADDILKNNFRKKVFNNAYFKVNTMLNKRFENIKSEEMTFQNKVEKELILKWLFKNRVLNKRVYESLKTENYEEVKMILDEANEHRFLSVSNEYLLKLINQYLEIKKTNTLPVVKGNGNDTFEAIDNNNYELALKLLENHHKEYNIEKTSYLSIMLKKLIDIDKKENLGIQKLIDAVSEMRQKYEDKTKKQLTDKEKQSLDSKIDKLYEGRSAFLLEPMPKEKRDLVQEYVNKFENIASFSIGEEPNRRVVLRHHPLVKEYVDRIEVTHEAKSLYHKGKYEEAAKKYELLLKLGRPRDIIYGMYGLTLLRMNKRNEALDYLKIATIISKENDGQLDYTDLIESIEYPQDKNNRKPRVEVKETEFTDIKKPTLSDELLNDLIGLTQEGEISLIDACIKLGLSEVDINYVKLIYARDCYYINSVKEGDLYLKQVEKSKSKDQRVKDLYKEILRDKKYYPYRLDEEKNQLVFKKRK